MTILCKLLCVNVACVLHVHVACACRLRARTMFVVRGLEPSRRARSRVTPATTRDVTILRSELDLHQTKLVQ
jgi:hypothetical protein